MGDDEADDDGLYLVLQPLNESGEMVPVAADLSVVILDPSGRVDWSNPAAGSLLDIHWPDSQ